MMMQRVKQFLSSDVAGGIVLITAAVLAMLLANLPFSRELYQHFLAIPLELRIDKLEINKNMLLWINDALMAIFFLLVGLEVKRELIQGSLASYQQAAFPVVAAIGGMLIPALIYLLFNGAQPVNRLGWAIPAATDIAFALGVLALLGSRVPPQLKIFLMALAIIDDLGAIIIIALFYTQDLSVLSLYIASAVIILLALLNLFKVYRMEAYILLALILWVAVLKSGVHATLAGVIVGFFTPLREKNGYSPARQLEHILHPWVTFAILPLFAFANAGVLLQGVSWQGLLSLLPGGIILGLVIGKPLGIGLFCWLAIKFRIAKLPQNTHFREIIAVGVLCGIGFTMSIFISTLAFGEIAPELIRWSKLGVLAGSILAALAGYWLLRKQYSVKKTLSAKITER